MTNETFLVTRAREGDEVAFRKLLDRYSPLIDLHLRGLYLHGGDEDDLRQEGRLGLYKAVLDYRPGRSSFANFASLCIQRNIVTALIADNRGKHGPLNESRSLSEPLPGGEGEERTLGDTLPDPAPDAVEIIELRRKAAKLGVDIRERLSELEATVLLRSAGGESYEEIAAGLGIDQKSVDNALQRARRKLGDTQERGVVGRVRSRLRAARQAMGSAA